MILGKRESGIGERRPRAIGIEPGGGDEARRRAPGDILDQCLATPHPPQRLGMGQAQEFAFAGGHVLRLEPGGGAGVPTVVAMRPAVDEHLDPLVRPAAQPPREGGGDRRAAPVIGHDQHRQPPPDVRREMVEQAVDLALEAGRDVVDRGEQAFHRARR